MATKNHARPADELRPEYDLTTLSGRVRRKYFKQATVGTTSVLLEPDVAEVFPTGRAVNRALRMHLRAKRGKLPNKLPPTAVGRASKKSIGRRG